MKKHPAGCLRCRRIFHDEDAFYEHQPTPGRCTDPKRVPTLVEDRRINNRPVWRVCAGHE